MTTRVPNKLTRDCIAVVVDLAARDPYDGGLGCAFCSGQQLGAHDPECVWARAKQIADGINEAESKGAE